MNHLNDQDEARNRDIVQEILQAMGKIRYGSVEIIIQDSKVVQIEIKEKVRFTKQGPTKER